MSKRPGFSTTMLWLGLAFIVLNQRARRLKMLSFWKN